MPQTFSVSDGPVHARACLRGFRRCFLFAWVPYMTGAKPMLDLEVKSQEAQLLEISLDGTERGKTLAEYPGIHKSGLSGALFAEKQIQLMPLYHGGEVEYNLTTRIRMADGSQQWRGGRIFGTGRIYERDGVILRFVLAVVLPGLGAGAALIMPKLIEWLKNAV